MCPKVARWAGPGRRIIDPQICIPIQTQGRKSKHLIPNFVWNQNSVCSEWILSTCQKIQDQQQRRLESMQIYQIFVLNFKLKAPRHKARTKWCGVLLKLAPALPLHWVKGVERIFGGGGGVYIQYTIHNTQYTILRGGACIHNTQYKGGGVYIQ